MDQNDVTTTSTKNLDWDAKKAICELWKKSPNLSMRDFCKQQGLSAATFYRWCRKLWPKPKTTKLKSKKSRKSNWIPVNIVTTANNKPKITNNTVELIFPNNIKATINLATTEITELVKEICNASTKNLRK